MKEKLLKLIRDKGGIGKFIKYMIVGISAVVVDFAAYKICFLLLGNEPISVFAMTIEPEKLANAAGVITGFVYSFILNRSWSFKSTSNVFAQIAMLILLLIFNTWVSSEAISLLGRNTPVPFDAAKLIMQVVIALWNYIIYDKIIYRK